MANYHLSMQVLSRGEGRKAVAAAAYRRATRLYDERYDIWHDYSAKGGVVHREFSIPKDAPEWVRDMVANSDHISQEFWNTVEAFEKRSDAQLAREIEFSLPVELTQEQGIQLAKEYIEDQFVSLGMVADWSVHWDNPENPHVHCMLSMRPLEAEGFGARKAVVIDSETGQAKRDRHGHIMYQRGDLWGSKEHIATWREKWAEYQNFHLRMHGHAVQVDHRSYREQGVRIEPTSKVGVIGAWMQRLGFDSDRGRIHAEELATARKQIMEDPVRVLEKVVRMKSVFHAEDVEREIARYFTKGSEDYAHAVDFVLSSEVLVALGQKRGKECFTIEGTIAAERAMLETAMRMAERGKGFATGDQAVTQAVATLNAEIALATGGKASLSEQQEQAVQYMTEGGRLKVLVGVAGAGKSTIIKAATLAWEAEGYRVKGSALSGVAAANLQDSGITAQTLHSMEARWRTAAAIMGDNEGRPLTENQRDYIQSALLTDQDILVIDEAGMVGSAQMQRVMAEADRAGAKVVLVGDDEQLQSIEAGLAFRDVRKAVGAISLDEVHRQRADWQREATVQFATHRTEDALQAYIDRDAIQILATDYGMVRRALTEAGMPDEEIKRFLRVAEYLEERRAAGAIWHDAKERKIQLEQHPDYARFQEHQERRNELAGEIAGNMPGHFKHIKHLCVDQEGFVADALSLDMLRIDAIAAAPGRVKDWFDPTGISEAERSYRGEWAGKIPAATPGQMTAQLTLADAYMQAQRETPEKRRLILAFTRNDVSALNRTIQKQMMQAGLVAADTKEVQLTAQDDQGEYRYNEHFGAGDRLMFRENSKEMGVMNGTLGTVKEIKDGHHFTVALDNGKEVAFSAQAYSKFQLGYAATVHKSQGVTVDETYVLATGHFDKHTSYVAMSRHKEQVRVYAAQTEFNDAEMLKRQLSRQPERYSTHDFAIDRGIMPASGLRRQMQEFVGHALTSIDLAGEKLAELWQRLEKAYANKRGREQTTQPPEEKRHNKEAAISVDIKEREKRILKLRERMLDAADRQLAAMHGSASAEQRGAMLHKMARYAVRAIELRVPDAEQAVTDSQLVTVQPRVKELQAALQEFKRNNREMSKDKAIQQATDAIQQAVFKAHPELQQEKAQGREREL